MPNLFYKTGRLLFLLLIILSLYILGGFYYTYQTEKKDLYNNVDKHLQVFAYIAVDILGKNFFNRVVDKDSITEKEDIKNIKILSTLTKYSDIKYVYTLIQKDNKIYFTSSSASREELMTQKNLTRYFDEYEEATDELKNAFEDKKIVYEESTDKWGTFRSVLIPMKNDKGDWFIVGVDLETTALNSMLFSKLQNYVFYSFGLILILILVWIVYISYYNEQLDKLKKANKELNYFKDKLEDEVHQKDRELFLLNNR